MRSRSDSIDVMSPPALTEAMRAWRAAHPKATFAEIECEAARQVAALQTELIVAALEDTPPEGAPRCVSCDRRMVRNGPHTRTMVTNHQERVTIHDHRYRCPACGTELFPLAEALGLGPSGYSPWIVEGAVRLGTDRSFAPAAALLQHFTGVTMSPATLRRLTIAVGTTMRHLELAFVANLPVGGNAEPTQAPMQLSVDGSMIALVDEGWREVKRGTRGGGCSDGVELCGHAGVGGDVRGRGGGRAGPVRPPGR